MMANETQTCTAPVYIYIYIYMLTHIQCYINYECLFLVQNPLTFVIEIDRHVVHSQK